MKQSIIQQPAFTIVGLKVRTNNQKEMNPKTACISGLIERFWQDGLADKILHRTQPGTVYSLYAEYDSNEHGDYSYFFGEQVMSLANQNTELFSVLEVPAQRCQQFTSNAGAMPQIVIEAWQSIWQMSSEYFEGSRAYQVDYEVYEVGSDPAREGVPICIGLLSKMLS